MSNKPARAYLSPDVWNRIWCCFNGGSWTSVSETTTPMDHQKGAVVYSWKLLSICTCRSLSSISSSSIQVQKWWLACFSFSIQLQQGWLVPQSISNTLDKFSVTCLEMSMLLENIGSNQIIIYIFSSTLCYRYMTVTVLSYLMAQKKQFICQKCC